VDLKRVAKSSLLDLWVCDHYRVLPTDERFLNLSDEQKNLLFVGYLERATDEAIYQSYHSKPEMAVTDEDADVLTKAGYSPAQIRRIRYNLEVAKKEATWQTS